MIFKADQVRRHWSAIWLCALLFLFLSILCALKFGAILIPWLDVFSWVFSSLEASQSSMIMSNLRLPRALLAAGIGALLASCGAAAQGLFRNPLADPSLIGVSAGASAGAGCVIVLLSSWPSSLLGLSLISLGAFGGAMISVFLVYRLSTGVSGTSVTTMLLVGIAMSFIAGSITNVFEFMADSEMLRRISLWRMGGLDSADYYRVNIIAMVLLCVFFLLQKNASSLNVLLLGESEARHLGIDVACVKKTIILCIAAGVGVSVAFAGTIIFLGLVIPHIVRIFIGPNHRYLLPMSALSGAILLVLADTFARTLLAPSELPVGLVTSIIGAPIFISLLRRRFHYGAH